MNILTLLVFPVQSGEHPYTHTLVGIDFSGSPLQEQGMAHRCGRTGRVPHRGG